jgi:serine/threonine-protein kinase
MATLESGTRFGKYIIVRLLGSGRDAEVYEVVAPNGARRALKIARPEAPLGSKPQARVAQEAGAVATIEHIHVVRFYDAGVEDGRVWMELELVDGLDLMRLCATAGGALAVDRAVRIVRQCAEGLIEAHEQGIVHRDLKPKSILVTHDDLAKVAGFNRAKVPAPSVRTTGDHDLSAALHTAPELMENRAAEPRSDVYSLATILYEIIAGHNPFALGGANVMLICKRQLFWNPPPLASLSTAERPIPDDLSALLEQALSKDPARRPSMRAFADTLGVVLARLDAPRRAIARNLALLSRNPALAERLPIAEVPPTSGRGGTIPMTAVQAPAMDCGPASHPAPSRPPSTQRSPSFFIPSPATRAPVRVAIATIEPDTPAPWKGTWAAIGLAAGAVVLGLLGAAWVLLGRG